FLGDASTDQLTINATTTVRNGIGLLGETFIGDAATDFLTVTASSTFVSPAGFMGSAFIGDASTDLLTVTASSTFVSNAGFLSNLQIGDAQADRLTINAGVINYGNSSTSTVPELVNAWSIGTTTAVGNSPILSIDGTNGRVGIGTTSPYGLFSVEMGTQSTAFAVSDQGTTSPSIMVSGNGQVGINAVPTLLDSQKVFNLGPAPGGTYALYTTGQQFIWSGSASLIARGLASTMSFSTANLERMRIDGTGLVGIGTSTPGAKLSLAGSGG
ncbi:MAG: hypothetical protein HYT40_01225, partial [Candidatus Sungbacteria bacterium]|nr:hypothetical protein [Candidatus Sungbacteria bacterium]